MNLKMRKKTTSEDDRNPYFYKTYHIFLPSAQKTCCKYKKISAKLYDIVKEQLTLWLISEEQLAVFYPIKAIT
jgi:hypothetical protein